MSANPAYKPSEGKREEFRKYLEKNGVMDALTKVLVSLYEEVEKPEDALEYIRNKLASAAGLETNKQLNTKLKEAEDRIQDLETKLAQLQTGGSEIATGGGSNTEGSSADVIKEEGLPEMSSSIQEPPPEQ